MVEGEPNLEMIASAVAGDGTALEELLLGYYDRLLRRVARKLPASLRGTVCEEDILQQTCAEAFLRIRSFQPTYEAAFFRWLVTIADHRLADAIKAHNRVKRGGAQAGAAFHPDSMDQLVDLVAAPLHTASQSVARHEAIAAVQVGLASLDDDHRRAIQLRYLQGLSVAETAKVMERSPRTVRELCYRGMEDLRAVMGRSSQHFSRR